MPYIARGLASTRYRQLRRGCSAVRRAMSGESHRLEVFVRVDDPYSYLLVQVMAEFSSRFDLELCWRVITDSPAAMYPEKQMWRDYAARDAWQLARLYQLDFPSAAVDLPPAAIDHVAAQLLSLPPQDFASEARAVLEQLWFDRLPASLRPLNSQQQKQLGDNQQRLAKLGHYAGAMIYCEPEWYWGIDRLDHLEQRLIDEGAGLAKHCRPMYTRGFRGFCRGARGDVLDPTTPLVLYWSARSPYSYLALERASQLADHYKIELQVKPVLPMMMRGMAVPPDKKMYIFHDTAREGRKLGIPYGFVADPLGRAVERCYALCDYARERGLLLAFLRSFARGVNAEGIDAATDKGLARIVRRCGLNWPEARTQLSDQGWRQWAQENLEEMYAMGCWGVPSFRYGDLVLWGQDRLGIIENALLGECSG